MILATLPIAILLLLLPGYAWLLLSGLIKRIGGLGSIAFSFIFSICLLSLSSAVLSLLTRNYLFYNCGSHHSANYLGYCLLPTARVR